MWNSQRDRSLALGAPSNKGENGMNSEERRMVFSFIYSGSSRVGYWWMVSVVDNITTFQAGSWDLGSSPHYIDKRPCGKAPNVTYFYVCDTRKFYFALDKSIYKMV